MNLNPAFKEALAAHEVFRRLGFTSDEIYARPTLTILQVVVRRNDLEFAYGAAEYRAERIAFIEEWKRAVTWWNSEATEEERKAIYNESRIVKDSVGLVVALHAKGFSTRRSDA